MKTKVKIIVVILLGLFVLVGYFLYSNYKDQKLKEESFKFYEYYNFGESNISKSDLISDTYLINLLKIDSYYSFDDVTLEELMIYYVLNITKNISEDIKVSEDSFSFSLSKKAFIKSMKELFGVDVSNIYEDFGDVDFVEIWSDRIYFNVDSSLIDKDEAYLLGVKSIAVSKNDRTITMGVYVYSFLAETEEEEKMIKNKLINSVSSGNFKEFNSLIEDNYGTYEEKVINFKEVPNGDFFKYQIVSLNKK